MIGYFSTYHKILLLLAIYTLSFNCIEAQQMALKTLAFKVNGAVNKITEATFVFNHNHKKIDVGEDSSYEVGYAKCYFKKMVADTLMGYKFASFQNNGYQYIYDGNFLFSFSPFDTVLEVSDKNLCHDKVKAIKDDYVVFPCFTYFNNYIQGYMKDTSFNKTDVVDMVSFEGEKCYRINMYNKPPTDNAKTTIVDYIYVSATTFLPVRFYLHFEKIVGKAKEMTTFDNWVSNFNTGKIDEKVFAKESIHSVYKEIKYSRANEADTSQLLPLGTVAPEWELPLITGGKIKLGDLKGKIVVMDFWFKSCPPCQMQMLLLESLNGKFDKDKVVFIGINTIDDLIKDKLALFIKNRDIKMLSAYNGKAIAPLYKVYVSPALIIIDKDGKIIFNLAGYSNTLKEDIVKLIQEHL